MISGIGAGGDIETVEPERSSAFTASHLGALLRIAQLARALGAELPELEQVPDAVAQALAGPAPAVRPPARLLEFTGRGDERVDGCRGRAQDARDVLRRDRGPLGRAAAARPRRRAAPGRRARRAGRRRRGLRARARDRRRGRALRGRCRDRISERELPELLSVFPLTVAVQRIALDLASTLGTNPDSFGRDRPGPRRGLDGSLDL